MARLKDTIVGKEGYGVYSPNPEATVDISALESGQQGISTNIAGYASNTAHMRKNIIAVLHEAPTGFQYLPNPEKWVAALKAMIELHSNSIEGLNATITTEYGEEIMGSAGEVMETESNATRERSIPVHTLTEKYGIPFNTLLTVWSTMLILDPDTNYPLIFSSGVDLPPEVLADFNSMTVLYFEPDATGTKVIRAWLCANMKPKTAGEVVGSRDLSTGAEITQYNIEFTAFTQVGAGVIALAQSYLDSMNATGVNPNLAPSFISEIEADVLASESGYSDSVNLKTEQAVTV